MPVDGSAPLERLLVVVVGRRRFGLPLRAVRGLLAREPGAVRAVFRGRSIAVVEASSLGLAGDGGDPGGGAQQLVIVGAAGDERALAVDRIEGFVDAGEVKELPALVAPFMRGAFHGVATQADGEMLVLDAAALLEGAADRLCRREAGEA